MEALGIKAQVKLRDLLNLKNENMQLRRQLTASKSANDLSPKEMLSKIPHIKSESFNDMNASITVKSQKDYSLPPVDISTINNNVLENFTEEENAASYQSKSE